MVVYHGTDASFDTFQIDYESYNGFKDGAYFTSNKKFAKGYTVKNNIMPVFLSIKDPLEFDGNGVAWNEISFKEVSKILNIDEDTLRSVVRPKYQPTLLQSIKEIFGKNKDSKYAFYNANALIKLARLLNKDGAYLQHLTDSGKTFLGTFKRFNADQIVVLDPNQIKSIDNQGTFSTQDNNIYNQKIVNRETRLENFYNSYVKLRTKTVEKAENETELRKRRSKLSSNSKLRETNLDAIMQEILGIYIYDADYSTTDSALRELNNLSESRYLTILNEEIDKLDRLLIPVDSLIAAVNNINKGYNKLSDYSKEVQDRLFNMPVYREATELPVITRAKSLKQYNAYQKIKYNKELNTFISNLKLTQLKLAARKYHLDTIKMFVEEYDRGFEDMKLKVLDEYLYRTSLLSKKAPKLQGTYNLLEDLAKGQSELDTRNANEQMQKYLMLLTSNKH